MKKKTKPKTRLVCVNPEFNHYFIEDIPEEPKTYISFLTKMKKILGI